MAEIEVDDAIILLLGAPSNVRSLTGRIEGITRLEKLVFLLEREVDLEDVSLEDAEYRPDNFGPFSAKIYQAVETLAAADLIEDSAELADDSEDAWEATEVVGTASDPYATRNFELKDRGRRYYQALMKELPPGTEKTLAEFKSRFATIPLRQLIRYVYTKYEPYTTKSKIRDDILR